MQREASGVGPEPALFPASSFSQQLKVNCSHTGSWMPTGRHLWNPNSPARSIDLLSRAEVPGAPAYILGKEADRLQGRLGLHRSPPSAEQGRLTGSCEGGLVSLSVPTGPSGQRGHHGDTVSAPLPGGVSELAVLPAEMPSVCLKMSFPERPEAASRRSKGLQGSSPKPR